MAFLLLIGFWFCFREFPPRCSIVGATVTVHQVFCILHCFKRKDIDNLDLASISVSKIKQIS